jgi:NADH dehydrogenase
MATILVTGASGFVGSHIVPALLDAGHRVVALVRSPDAADRVLRRLTPQQADGLETRQGDVTRRDTLPGALGGVDTVLHLVAIPRDFSGGAELRLVNTEGTRNVVAAMREAGVRRLVHQGALGVTDDPNLHYASSKAKAEALVADSGLDWTILKPSILWGERDGFFNVIADLVRISPGLLPIPAGATSRYQPMWIGDLARIATRVVDDPATVARTYELGGPERLTYREMTEEVLRGMRSRRAILPMPQPLIRLVARSSELVRLPFPVASDQLRQLAFDNVTAPDSVERSFGFAPRPMAGGLDYLRRKRREQEPGAG